MGAGSHHRSSPWQAQMCPWLNWRQCQLSLPGRTLRKRGQSVQCHSHPRPWAQAQPPRPDSPAPWRDICMAYAICSSSVILLRSGSPGRPNSCWLMVIFSRASSESGKRRGRQSKTGAMFHRTPKPHPQPITPHIADPHSHRASALRFRDPRFHPITFSASRSNPGLRGRRRSCPPSLLLLSLPLLFHGNAKGLAKGGVRLDMLPPQPWGSLLGAGGAAHGAASALRIWGRSQRGDAGQKEGPERNVGFDQK